METDINEALIKASKKAELWMQVYDFTNNQFHVAERIEEHLGGQDYKKVVKEAKLEVTLMLIYRVFEYQDR